PIYKFSDLTGVETVLERFASRELVVKLEKSAGERDHRWTHLLTGAPILPIASDVARTSGGSSDLINRIETLESEMLALRAELEAIKNKR
ncbi:MAG: hypothetical protein RLZZ156_1333, partial [Deinococcota bacterium]